MPHTETVDVRPLKSSSSEFAGAITLKYLQASCQRRLRSTSTGCRGNKCATCLCVWRASAHAAWLCRGSRWRTTTLQPWRGRSASEGRKTLTKERNLCVWSPTPATRALRALLPRRTLAGGTGEAGDAGGCAFSGGSTCADIAAGGGTQGAGAPPLVIPVFAIFRFAPYGELTRKIPSSSEAGLARAPGAHRARISLGGGALLALGPLARLLGRCASRRRCRCRGRLEGESGGKSS